MIQKTTMNKIRKNYMTKQHNLGYLKYGLVIWHSFFSYMKISLRSQNYFIFLLNINLFILIGGYDTIDQLDLIDIYRTFHPKTMIHISFRTNMDICVCVVIHIYMFIYTHT